MNLDQLNDARADIATNVPADENDCCELGCDACEPARRPFSLLGRIKEMMTEDSRFADAVMVAADVAAAPAKCQHCGGDIGAGCRLDCPWRTQAEQTEPLAPESIEVVRKPSWHRYCGCGRLRARIEDGTIGHKAGCLEAN